MSPSSLRVVFGFGFALLLALAAPAAFAQSSHAPVIEHIEPTSGPVGTEVAIVGRYFTAASEVRIDATPLTARERLPNRITVQIPEAAQTGHVRVTTANGTQLGPEFRVTAPLPAPRITAIEPNNGPPGARVVLRGENFSPRLTRNVVSLSSVPVLVRSATPTAIEVTVPEGATSGSFEVKIAQAGEAKSEAFTVAAGTTVTDFRPRRGGPGSELVLYGTGFSTQPADNRVYLNNVPAKVTAASKTELKVELPRRAATGPVLVDVRGAGRALTAEPFVVQQPPSVLRFSPTTAAPGSLVTVHGTGFGKDPAVVEARLGDNPLPVRQASETMLVLELPQELAANGRLSIRVSGVGPAWSERDLVVERLLSVEAFAPESGPVGTEVTLRGSGFDPDPRHNKVRFGRRQAEVLKASPTELVVRAPASGSGSVSVTVGKRMARGAGAFVVTSPPSIRNVVPQTVEVGGELRVYGHGFGDKPALVKVRLAGVELEVRSVRDDAITLKALGAPRTGAVDVEVALQGKVASTVQVQVLSNLVVGAPEPPAARVGEVVELGGKGFEGTGIVVEFGGVASTPSSVQPERLRVVVPKGAKSGLVTVRLADGRAAPSASAFAVQAN